MIKIGCSGYPVGKRKYQSTFSVVEVTKLRDAFSSTNIVQKWRDEAPKEFEFVLCASRIISHPRRQDAEIDIQSFKKTSLKPARVGYFQDSSDVNHAYRLTKDASLLLQSRIVFFEVPTTLYPQTDNIGRLQKFFKQPRQQGITYVWQAPAHWPEQIIKDLSTSLNLVPATDPFVRPFPWVKTFNYFRLNKPKSGPERRPYFKSDFEALKKACGHKLSYVIFNTGPFAFNHATDFQDFLS